VSRKRTDEEPRLISIAATGPRFVLTYSWATTWAGLQGRLAARDLSILDIVAVVISQTTKSICAIKSDAAFIQLGGRIQFQYVTDDGYTIATHVISRCEGGDEGQ
jgi:hypothetical protein